MTRERKDDPCGVAEAQGEGVTSGDGGVETQGIGDDKSDYGA